MSECVVRMEMPSNCEKCPMCGTASGGNGVYKLWCMCGDIPASSWRRPEDCPILCQLPEGHGRLIDWDAFERTGFKLCRKTSEWRAELGTPTNKSYVVPAERSETEQV